MYKNIPSPDLTEEQLNQRLAALESLVEGYKQREAELERRLAAEQAQRHRAEMLYQSGTALTSTLDHSEILDRILDEVRHLIPHDATSVMLIEADEARIFRRRGYADFDSGNNAQVVSLKIADTPTLRRIQETGLPLVIPAVEQDATWVEKPDAGWIKSYLGAPLYIQNRLIGFLNLNSAIPFHFKPDDVERLQTFVSQAAIALKNARLYDQLRQESIERVRALKRERNFISAVLDTAGALVLVLNRHGRIVRFNRACEQTTGYTFEEVRGKFWWDIFLPPEEIEPIKAEFEALWLNQPPKRYENEWVTKGGQRRLISWSNTVITDSKGAIEYILNTGIDLTERRQAEDALHSSEERFREVVSSISDHVYVTRVTEDGYPVNLYLSPHIVSLTGYPRERFLDDWLFWPTQIIHPEDRAMAAVQAAKLMMGQNSEVEYRLVRADGRTIWVRDSGRSQQDGSSRIIYGVVSDITERKQAEEQLKVTNKQLQELTSRLQEELILAQKIQQSLLPIGHPGWSGLDMVCYTVPAREVGGDFYAYHAFQKDGGGTLRVKAEEDPSVTRGVPPSTFAIAVGDVSGKGMPAALLMAASLTALQSIIGHSFRPSSLLAELDLALIPYTKTTLQNCALCYAEITPPGPEQPTGSLRVANAGCVTPLIGRIDGRVEWVEVGGLPLGVGLGADIGYTEATFTLNSGDVIVFTSDGLIEATNAAGELFSFDRLEQAVANGPKTGAAAMLAYLRAEVARFTGDIEPRDDLTIVVVRV